MDDFDQNKDKAWAECREAWADRVTALQKGDSFMTLLPYEPPLCDAECVPHMVFSVTGSNRVRCSIPPLCNGSRWRPHALLTSLGFKDRRSGWYVLELGRRYPDKLAAVAVRVLREIWGIEHPAFLADAPSEPAVWLAVQPRDRRHLTALVVQTLEALTTEDVELDEDDSVCLGIGGRYSWIRVDDHAPIVEFATMLAEPVADFACAAEMLAEHSACWPGINLTLRQTGCFAVLRSEASAFVARNFEASFVQWYEFMDGAAGRIAAALDNLAGGPDPDGSIPPTGCKWHDAP